MFIFVQTVNSDCVDGMLYCYDSKSIRFPKEITVGQCWKWSILACEPCQTELKNGKSSYQKYLPLCRTIYPNAALVLETKSVWAKKVKDIIQGREHAKGKYKNGKINTHYRYYE